MRFVFKGVHLLLHDIRFIADATDKKLRHFEDWGPNLLESENAGDLPRSLFKRLPILDFFPVNIVRALRTIDQCDTSAFDDEKRSSLLYHDCAAENRADADLRIGVSSGFKRSFSPRCQTRTHFP